MRVPAANAMLPSNRWAGIITISGEHLSDDHLEAAGVPPDPPVVGTGGGREFSRKILDDLPEIHFAPCRRDFLNAAGELISAHDDIGAIVLECTNMSPDASDIRRMTGLPVHSICTLVCRLQSGLEPQHFPIQLDDPVRPTN